MAATGDAFAGKCITVGLAFGFASPVVLGRHASPRSGEATRLVESHLVLVFETHPASLEAAAHLNPTRLTAEGVRPRPRRLERGRGHFCSSSAFAGLAVGLAAAGERAAAEVAALTLGANCSLPARWLPSAPRPDALDGPLDGDPASSAFVY